MNRTCWPIGLVLLLCIAASAAAQTPAADARWRISPEKINLVVGEDRELQLLDDEAQELDSGTWSIDRLDLADFRQDDHGHAFVHAKAAGSLKVTATIGAESRVREITIWAADAMPEGTTHWALHPIGLELGDIPAVPGAGGPNVFSLEQTAAGSSYLRADAEDGIQVWTWKVPESVRDVELLCGDWLGGAVVAAARGDSYTIYDVRGDGTVRWKYEARGRRTGFAISTENLVHLVTQFADGTNGRVTGINGQTGVIVYDLAVPESTDRYFGVRASGGAWSCAAGAESHPSATTITRPFVHADGDAYVAFTVRVRTIAGPACDPGATVAAADTSVTREERMVLWRIHPDGSHRTTEVEGVSLKQTAAAPVTTVSPTRSLTPNSMRGVLIPVRVSRRDGWLLPDRVQDDFVYGVDGDGTLRYKAPMPQQTGILHDEMVLGENHTAFAARGGMLIAFDEHTGKELWRWDSGTPEIEVFAALANGHCAVQTPTALVEVADHDTSRELVKGKAMMDWLGHVYVKHR